MTVPAPLTRQQQEYLKLLAIFHYIVAGLGALMACLPVFHLGIGLGLLLFPDRMGAKPEAMIPGAALTAIGGGAILAGWAMAAAVAFAGRSLQLRQRHTYCLVVAGLMGVCCQPLGSVLAVFTFIVLLMPEVKQAFSVARSS